MISTPTSTPYITSEIFWKSRANFYQIFPANLILSLVILPLNTFVIYHYFGQKGKFVPAMYMLIGTADNLTTISLLLQHLVLWLISQEYLTDRPTIAYTVTLFVASTGISSKLSVFSNVVLSVARTIKIKRPFERIKRRAALASIAIYGTFWAVLAIVDVVKLVQNDEMDAFDTFMSYPYLGAELTNLLAESTAMSSGCDIDVQDCYNETLGRSAVFILLTVAYLLPVLVVFLCMIIQLCSVRRPREVERAGGTDTQRHVTITILQITTLFFLCHVTATVWYLSTDLTVKEHDLLSDIIPGYRTLNGAVYSTLPLINAALSPVIIIYRSYELWNNFQSVIDALCCCRKVCKRHVSRYPTMNLTSLSQVQAA